MVDRAVDKPVIESTWRALGGRIAVSAASLAALVSLWCDAPAHVAVLRGAAAWALVLLLSRLGLAALCRAIDLDQRSGAER